jgi:hypothetical protein
MKKVFLIFIATIAIITNISAQENNEYSETDEKYMYVGVGAGFDYGGFGVKLELVPAKHFGLFGGMGYNLHSIAWNLGGSYKLLPDKKVSPTLCAFYGYNGVLILKNGSNNYDGITSYGLTLGGGVDIKFGRKNNKLSFNLFLPFRSKEFMDSYESLKNQNSYTTDLLPVTISIGYNFNAK